MTFVLIYRKKKKIQPSTIANLQNLISHSILCLCFSLDARSSAVLLWQFTRVGSAPQHSNSVHTSDLRQQQQQQQQQQQVIASLPVLPQRERQLTWPLRLPRVEE